MFSLDNRAIVLEQGESLTLKIASEHSTLVQYYAKFESAGTVDATVQARGSMYLQGEPTPLFHEPTPSTVSAEGEEIQTLNQWPFVQTELVITNNSADDLVLNAALIGRG